VCGIGANDQHHIGLFYGLESLRPCRCSVSLPQPIACRRMADPRASINIVIAKGGTHHLLHEIGFFVGAARRGDTAHRTDSMRGLDSADLRSRVVDRLFPAHHLPRIVDGLAYHRSRDAVLVGGVSPGKAPLHTGMPLIGLAVLPRHHAHNLVALHFRLETASHPAVGAGSDHGMLWLTHLNDRFFLQRRSWTGLHACSTGDAIAFQESLRLAGHYPGREPLAVQREGKRALHFFAGPNTPAAYNALGRVV